VCVCVWQGGKALTGMGTGKVLNGALGEPSTRTMGVVGWPCWRKYETRGTVRCCTVAASMLGRQSITITAASSVVMYSATLVSSCPFPANPKLKISRPRFRVMTAS
jgi:hypothetical protein